MSKKPDTGLVLGSELPPENIGSAALAGEEAGFDELWLSEDCFFTGGISGAATALSSTSRIPVGTGILSAMVRHPALLAMEMATLARIHPGRVRPGVGLGIPAWLAQMGLTPKSNMDAVHDCTMALRQLLGGEKVSAVDGTFDLSDIQLTHGVTGEQPPIYMGAVGPKMLRLSGEIADGVLLSALAGPRYVEWAKEKVIEGCDRAGTSCPRLTTFALFSVDENGDLARERIRPVVAFYLNVMLGSPLVSTCGIAEPLEKLAAGGQEQIARLMPDEWIEEVAIAGTPKECTQAIRRLTEAGSDSVSLFPAPSERAGELIELAGTSVLPLL